MLLVIWIFFLFTFGYPNLLVLNHVGIVWLIDSPCLAFYKPGEQKCVLRFLPFGGRHLFADHYWGSHGSSQYDSSFSEELGYDFTTKGIADLCKSQLMGFSWLIVRTPPAPTCLFSYGFIPRSHGQNLESLRYAPLKWWVQYGAVIMSCYYYDVLSWQNIERFFKLEQPTRLSMLHGSLAGPPKSSRHVRRRRRTDEEGFRGVRLAPSWMDKVCIKMYIKKYHQQNIIIAAIKQLKGVLYQIAQHVLHHQNLKDYT